VRLEHRIDGSRRPARVIGQCHGRTTEDVYVRNDAAAHQTITEPTEGILNRSAVKQRIGLGHATSSSCGATYTPRRLNAAGA
jgi:hypothetical protein